jgi:alpha-glucosidase
LDEIENNSTGGQPHYFFSNHDQPRQWDRYGDSVHNDQIAKLLAALLLTTRATPQMYYGEELGMRTTDPVRKEDVQDPIGKLGWPKEKGRDGERTPMQWDTSRNAGFSSAAKTWLPVAPSASRYNVAVESRDPGSILNFYKRLLSLRQSETVLRDGGYIALNRDDPHVLSFLRKSADGHSVIVALNMSAQPHTVAFDLTAYGLRSQSATLLLAAPRDSRNEVSLKSLVLPPFGVLIASVR